MIPELAAQYAARASGAAISETSIKEITCVLNGRTQRSHRAILLSRPLLDPRTHDEIARFPQAKKKPRSCRERGSNVMLRIPNPTVANSCRRQRHDACARCLSHDA
jgi:hypothetical protein